MKLLIVLMTTVLTSNVFAGPICNAKHMLRQAQVFLNYKMNEMNASEIYRGAQIDRKLKPYSSNNEGGYDNYVYEAKIQHVNKAYDSENNDLLVNLYVNEKCEVVMRASEVKEISAE